MPKTSEKKARMSKEWRTEVISFKASPKEKEIMERLASQAGVPLSQYVRGSVMSDMIISGDIEAMKYSLSLLGNSIREAIREKVFIQDSNEPILT